MLKRTAIIGLALILISAALFEWTRRQPPPLDHLFPGSANDTEVNSQAVLPDDMENYPNLDQLLETLQNKPKEELKKEQQTRLIEKIDQLASETGPTPIMAEILYGPNWQIEVAQYKRLTERQEFATIASIVLGFLGLLAIILAVVFASARMILELVSTSVRFITKKPTQVEENVVLNETPDTQPVSSPEVFPLRKLGQQAQLKTDDSLALQPLNAAVAADTESLAYRRDGNHSPLFGFQTKAEEEKSFDLFMTDQDSVQTFHAIESDESSRESKTASSLEERTEEVVRQITQVQENVAANETQTSTTAEPFNDTLQQLNDQISAIRNYASSQQDRVEKLQNGYDWNIIRTFCLRIIRCIDNLDDRIGQMSDDAASTEMLREIRDELLFALESSGVEQFDLEQDSEFCGQERLAEAIKEKEIGPDPELKGRIARIVKSGYQYVIDDENVKIVRTARVKLYG